jgi:hypothetical protein
MVNLDSLEKVLNKNHNKVFKVEQNKFLALFFNMFVSSNKNIAL